MKLRQSLRNSAKLGLFKISILLTLLSGCTLSTTPTYLKEDIGQAIHDICKKEFNIEVKAKLEGQTLWVYLPVENIFEKSNKPEKSIERFEVSKNECKLSDGAMKLDYMIKPVPEKESVQESPVIYSKDFMKKYYNVRSVILRVLFSMEHSKKEPQFIYIVSADIKNGFEIKELTYYLDLKKVTYDFISSSEYQHRTVQDLNASADIIGDKAGAHIVYHDVTLGDFIAKQIQQRIKLKFQKPEVTKDADIDKEIIKIIVYTIKIYKFRDFSAAELTNEFTNNRVLLNQAAVWARPIE